MRRLAAVALLALIATGAALAAKGDPRKHHTAADQAKAKSIVVRLSDLGAGWTGKKSPNSGGHLHCKGFEPDESALVETGKANSLDFSKGLQFVSSNAALYATAAQAQTAWNLVVQPGLLTCLKALFEQGGSSGGATTTVKSQGPLAFPKLAARTAAYRIVFQTKSGSQTLSGDLDVVLLGAGRIDTAMLLLSVGVPHTALEQHLAGVVAARVR